MKLILKCHKKFSTFKNVQIKIFYCPLKFYSEYFTAVTENNFFCGNNFHDFESHFIDNECC